MRILRTDLCETNTATSQFTCPWKAIENMLRGCARLLRATAKNGTFRMVPAVGYKSQYSVDKLYPNSNPDFISNPVLKVSVIDDLSLALEL